MNCVMWLCLASAPSRRLRLLTSKFMCHALHSSAPCSAGRTTILLHTWLLLAQTPGTPPADPFLQLAGHGIMSVGHAASKSHVAAGSNTSHTIHCWFSQSGYLGATALHSQQPQQHDHFTVRSSAAGSPSQVVQLGKLMSRTAVSAAAAAVPSADTTQRRAQIAVGSSGRAVPSGKLWLCPLQCCALCGNTAAVHLLLAGRAHCQRQSAATCHPFHLVTQPCTWSRPACCVAALHTACRPLHVEQPPCLCRWPCRQGEGISRSLPQHQATTALAGELMRQQECPDLAAG